MRHSIVHDAGEMFELTSPHGDGEMTLCVALRRRMQRNRDRATQRASASAACIPRLPDFPAR